MYSCNDCGNLDKSKKEINNNCYRYGCKARKEYICAWLVRSDSELNNMGCSSWREKLKGNQIVGQISMF